MLKIEEVAYPRQGVLFHFVAMEPNENGEPVGDSVSADLIVPPLNFYWLERLNGDDFAQLPDRDKTIGMIDFALRRNYRNVPRWLIEQTIDVANIPAFTRAVMDNGGKYREEVEAEKKAMTATANSTGPVSTPT